MKSPSERNVSVLKLNNYEIRSDFPSAGYFILFLADNTENPDIEMVSKFMDIMLEKGMVYLCSWGRNCELIHDIADQKIIASKKSNSDDITILTTWHKNTELAEGLWFALNTAIPSEKYCREMVSVIALSVNDEALFNEMEYYIKNQDILDKTIET